MSMLNARAASLQGLKVKRLPRRMCKTKIFLYNEHLDLFVRLERVDTVRLIMPLVSCVVLPHGAMVLDGGGGYTAAASERLSKLPQILKEDCSVLFKASCEAAAMAKATKPDVIFLNTPHGICLSSSCCVYVNKKAKGNAEWNNQWKEYDVHVDLDSDLAKAFLEHLQTDGVSAEGMVAFTACEAPLRWGEVIPLWFFRDLTAAGMKVVIYSNPLSRKLSSFTETTRVGHSVGKFLSGLKERVLYVASGDLAHTHITDCTLPLYLPDPRWNMPKSETAIPFDVCIENWLKCAPFSSEDITGPLKTTEKCSTTLNDDTIADAERWLSRATNLKQSALSCGIYGFGVLHGMLSVEVEKQASFEARLLCRLAPTYFGMAVAAYIKK